MKNNFSYIIGWCGVVALLSAYGLVSFGVLASNGFLYQLLNISGAMGIAINAFNKKDQPAMFLNIVWTLIGTIALLNIFRT